MLTALHLPTVALISAVIELLCLMLMIALWRQNRTTLPGLGLWVLNYSMQCTGLLFLLLRGVIPDVWSIGLPNLLFVLGAWMGYLGLEAFIAIRRPKGAHALVLGFFLLTHVYLVATGADINTRSLSMSLGSAWVFIASAVLLFRHTPPPLKACTRWVGRVLLIGGVIYTLRSVALYRHHFLDAQYFQSDWREAFFLVIIVVLFVLLTYAIGLMVNQRLLIRVATEREKFAKAFSASPQAVLLSRLDDGHLLDVNQGFTRIFGFSEAEAVGRTSLKLGIWPDASERTRIVDQVQQDTRIDNLPVIWRNRNGAEIHGLYSGTIIDLDGTPCLLSIVTDITTRIRQQQEREKLLADREKALAEVRVLSGLLPICASCKKIRDDKGYWNQLESYILEHSNAAFTHGICPDCIQRLYPDYQGDTESPPPSPAT
jgi:PAS domain S-box-containing protein